MTESEGGSKNDPFCRIKTSDGSDGNPVIGFKSEALGKEWAGMKELAGWGSVVSESALTGEQLTKLKELKILFLETPDEVHACAKNWDGFDFVPHVLTFAAVKSKLAEQSGIKASLFLPSQILPPVLMCAFLIVFFHYEFIVFVGPPLLYSACRVAVLLYKRSYPRLLRPALTVILSLIFLCMWKMSAKDADLYVQKLSREIQAQCNRDHICKVPTGTWVPSNVSNTEFTSVAPGPLPMRMRLSFDDYVELETEQEHRCTEATPHVSCHDSQPTAPFTTFRLAEMREDSYPPIYGGVGHTLHRSSSRNYDQAGP